MKIKKSIFLLIIFLGILFLFNTSSYAGSQKWNALDYDVTVNSDGSMDVIETWNIKISETNTLFKDFNLDSSKYSGITNVKVSRIDNNEEIPLREIFQEQYYVDSGCYYGLKLNSSKFEIAWNVGLDDSSATRTYKIYYTINDVVKIYNDCTEIYWMFLGNENSISGNNITGTVKLPKKVSNIEKLRVWAHGDLTGEIQRESEDTVTFKLPKLSSGSMLEIRIVTEENIYENSTNEYNINNLQNILDEEQKWADEANKKRNISKLIVGAVIVINIVIILFFINKIKKYIKLGKELDKYKYPKSDLKYFRDIPNEKEATPARAIYLYNFQKNFSNLDNSFSKIFSATMLDLALKGLVEFEPIDKKDVKIMKKSKVDVSLTGDEEIIYSIFLDACKGKGEITTKEFAKYAKKEYEYFHGKFNNLKSIVEEYQKENRNIDKERENIAKEWKNKITLYIVILVLSFMFMAFFVFIFPIYICLIACLAVCINNLNKISTLSEIGNQEKNEWHGLKNYMEDFSLLKEKEVPDLILWERYLVYATAFGISKKVIEQLKVVYPQIMDDSTYSSNYTYLYLMGKNNFGNNFINTLDNSLSRIYDSAQSAYSSAYSYSSGSGGGGGFSGGGGGRRRRWPVAVDAKSLKNLIGEKMFKKRKSYLVPVIGFALIILIGTILLVCPVSNNGAISFKDALFTAVSGVTCTGLTKVCVANQFNFIGQLVLAILMEIGAMGFVVFISYVWAIRGKKVRMSNIIMVNDNISGDNYSQIKETSIFIFNLMIKVQIAGIILLSIRFIPQFGFLQGLWYSIFHTISAFANAGFDIIGPTSVYEYKEDIYVQIVLILLMVLGSIGIFAIEDLKINKYRNFKKLKLQTKIILSYSLALIIIPTILLLIFEDNISILNSLFMSATSRSTGFSIVNLKSFTEISKILLIVLMFIGGSPASTAGGVRIVSIAIILSTIFSTLKGKSETIVFWKKIPNYTVRKAFSIFMIFLLLLLITISVFAYYNNINILNITFECVSAVTNTGLSVIDSNINLVGDIILMILMFTGRVGPLTMILVFVNEKESEKLIEYPTENIIL